jgi:hypothetical protein
MTTQKALPEYPETKAIFRAGLRPGTSLDRLQRHAESIAKSIARASMPLMQRFVSIPEYQEAELRHFLRREDTKGAEIVVRPCGTFGADQTFHEHCVTKNTGQILLIDATDFGTACIEYAGRVNGEPQLCDQAFSAHFVMASKLAVERDAKEWGFQMSQKQGPRIGIQRRNASLTTRWQKEAGFSMGQHYIRNFIVLRPNARGFWPSLNYKEDLGRSVSEGITGRYETILIRFFGRNAEDMDTPEGRAAEKSLTTKYGLSRIAVQTFIHHKIDVRKYKGGL